MKGCIISIKVNHLCLKYSIRTADISHIVEQKYKKHCALSYRVKNSSVVIRKTTNIVYLLYVESRKMVFYFHLLAKRK